MPGHGEAQRLVTVSGYDLGRFRALEVDGECDISTEADLWSALVDAPTVSSGAVSLDLSHLDFCDSACAEMVLAVGSTCRLVLAPRSVLSSNRAHPVLDGCGVAWSGVPGAAT